jgi:hypothetical protein
MTATAVQCSLKERLGRTHKRRRVANYLGWRVIVFPSHTQKFDITYHNGQRPWIRTFSFGRINQDHN